MKILIVTGIFPPDIGGPASYVPRMARALLAIGHEIEVVTLADREVVDAAPQDDFPVHRILRQQSKFLRVPRSVMKIRALAADADVLFGNGLAFEATLAARSLNKPIVFKVVGDTIWERFRNGGGTLSLDEFQIAPLPLRWRLLRWLQTWYMQAAAAVITPSRYLKRVVEGWDVLSDRVVVVYNAVRPAPAPTGLPASEFDLVSVGRLVPWKGFEQLIQLASRRGFSLSIIGDGPLRAQLEAQARSCGASVHFAGQLRQEDVVAGIRRGRIFVLNSSYEGLPHIVLEAMAAGVPVVATAAGGTPETIVDGVTGILVPVRDDAALERAIVGLMASPEQRAAIAAAALERLAQTFSFEHMVDETAEVLTGAAMAASRST